MGKNGIEREFEEEIVIKMKAEFEVGDGGGERFRFVG